MITILPQAMVAFHNDEPTYEGYYLLGLDTENPGVDIPAAREVLGRWHQELAYSALTKKAQVHINVLLHDRLSDLEQLNLEPCTRIWPRPILRAESNGQIVEEEDSDSFSNPGKNPKKDKNNHSFRKRDGKGQTTTVKVPEVGKVNAAEKHDNSKKSSPLRRAKYIISRLRTDNKYDVDEFVVGYRDRHSERLLEKAVVDWVTETTDQDWIPEHKIEYFKQNRGGEVEIVWEKASKLDKISTKMR